MRLSMKMNSVICAVMAASLVAPTHLLAGQPTARTSQSAISDAVLDSNGAITCRLLDRQGRPVANELVQIRQGRKLVAQAKTDSRGNFRLVGLKGGLYRIQSKDSQRLFRFWTARTAPPSAKSKATLVKRASMSQPVSAQPVAQVQQPTVVPATAPESAPIVRGNIGLPSMGLSGMVDGVSLITLGSSISAAALTAVTLNKINDVEDKVDRIPTSP